jgi:hypothetical protein
MPKALLSMGIAAAVSKMFVLRAEGAAIHGKQMDSRML